METDGIRDEIRSYLGVLEKGKLTEIDLDSIGGCLREALGCLESQRSQLDELAVLRANLTSEILSLVRANRALADSTSNFELTDATGRLDSCSAADLIEFRRRARSEFSRLRRQGLLPRRTIPISGSEDSTSEYRVERG